MFNPEELAAEHTDQHKPDMVISTGVDPNDGKRKFIAVKYCSCVSPNHELECKEASGFRKIERVSFKQIMIDGFKAHGMADPEQAFEHFAELMNEPVSFPADGFLAFIMKGGKQ